MMSDGVSVAEVCDAPLASVVVEKEEAYSESGSSESSTESAPNMFTNNSNRVRGALADKLCELQGLNGELSRVNEQLSSELARRDASLLELKNGQFSEADVESVRQELHRQSETISSLQNEITKLNGKHRQACKVLVDRLDSGGPPASEIQFYEPEAASDRASCVDSSKLGLFVQSMWNAVWRPRNNRLVKEGSQEAMMAVVDRLLGGPEYDNRDDDDRDCGEVNLSHCNLGDKDVVDLCVAIAGSKMPIEKLLLGGNRIGWRGAARLAELLQSKRCVVTTLNLRWNWLGETGAARLASVLELNNTLIDLDLWKNDVGPGAAAAIRDALRHNQSLERLCLWGNRLRDVGIVQIAKGLAENSSLLRLDVSDNQLGSEGVEAIARALTNPKCALRHLSCGQNPISSTRGACALAAALPGSRLESLDLEGNLVGDTGAAAISKALTSSSSNNTLTELNLASNNISTPGANALVPACSSTSLVRLRLDSNAKCGPAALGLIKTPLLELTLAHVDVGNDLAIKIAELLLARHHNLTAIDLCDTGLDLPTKKRIRHMSAALADSLSIKL